MQYSHSEILSGKKKKKKTEGLISAIAWMDFENVALSGRSHSQKSTCCVRALTRDVRNRQEGPEGASPQGEKDERRLGAGRGQQEMNTNGLFGGEEALRNQGLCRLPGGGRNEEVDFWGYEAQ